ncbi:F-box-like/WD repeat-containing protein ebi isoform X2 [Hydractinia symbiolongicarpus]|uniref:F-box-like/WD repeat-containing protein ebi isoform X2 n=1 Tax=Hydractinia symbiolongicarpus TaxID=13093 RepID=UPI00254D4605|nr:F-box-like/WD repeat-containing protein ebi isoform X2 [Hydractinia symbiolongicarpus]
MMSILSDEVNFLVYRYLQESGYQHSAYSFGIESHVVQSNINGSLVPPGALVNILQKGIQFIEGELCINDDGSLIDNLDSLGNLPLIDAVIPESLADRAASMYRLISQRTEINKKIMPQAINQTKQNTDGEIIFNGHKSEVFSCSWHPSCTYLATGAADGIVGVWSMDTDHSDMMVLDHSLDVGVKNQSADITSICWHPDGHYLATTSALDYSVRIWEKAGNFVTSLAGHNDLVLTLKWNKAGNFLLSASLDKKCITWKTENWQNLQEFQCHTGPIVDTDWQSNVIFASCSTDGTICVSQVGSEDAVKNYIGHTDVINSIEWDPSGTILASCSDDRLIKLWNLKQTRALCDLSGHTKEVTQVRWSSKRLLASASYDTSVRVWDAEHAVCLYTLTRHVEPVNSISFHPDGTYLVSASLDGYINIWELQTGNFIVSKASSAGVFEACWSPNGLYISMCMADKAVKILDSRKLLGS